MSELEISSFNESLTDFKIDSDPFPQFRLEDFQKDDFQKDDFLDGGDDLNCAEFNSSPFQGSGSDFLSGFLSQPMECDCHVEISELEHKLRSTAGELLDTIVEKDQHFQQVVHLREALESSRKEIEFLNTNAEKNQAVLFQESLESSRREIESLTSSQKRKAKRTAIMKNCHILIASKRQRRGGRFLPGSVCLTCPRECDDACKVARQIVEGHSTSSQNPESVC